MLIEPALNVAVPLTVVTTTLSKAPLNAGLLPLAQDKVPLDPLIPVPTQVLEPIKANV